MCQGINFASSFSSSPFRHLCRGSDRFSAAPGVCCEPGPKPSATVTAKSEVTDRGGRAGIADRGGRAGPGLDITLSTLWAATLPGSRAARDLGHAGPRLRPQAFRTRSSVTSLTRTLRSR